MDHRVLRGKKIRQGDISCSSTTKSAKSHCWTRPVYTHPLPKARSPLSLDTSKRAMVSVYIAVLVFTKAWCRFSTFNFDVIPSCASFFSLIVPGMPWISTGAPNNERSHASTNLTTGRSTLKRASGMLSLRMVSLHLLPLIPKLIALSLSSNPTKSSWTLYWESQRVATFKYQTLNSDWTPRAASSTDRANRLGSILGIPKTGYVFEYLCLEWFTPKLTVTK